MKNELSTPTQLALMQEYIFEARTQDKRLILSGKQAELFQAECSEHPRFGRN